MPSVATTGPETYKASKQTSPPTEREPSATDKYLPVDLNASSASEKQHRSSIVELKNGRVLFKQKPISFEKQSETLQEIVKFRAMLEERVVAKEPPLSAFPEEFHALIAKLAHESDKTLSTLAKHIHHELLPTLDEDEDQNVASATSAALPVSTVERVIQDVLVRNNYGIDVPLGVKPSAAISVWRWEVRNQHMDWLPKNSREKAETRHAERVQAKEDLKVLFNSHSQEERDNIIDPKGAHKLPPKELNKPTKSQTPEAKGEDETSAAQSSQKHGKKKAEDTENENQGVTKPSRAKKAVDPEKAAKEKEKLEKKAAKAEREKKDKEAHSKSQSIMAKFFAKPKPPMKPAKTQEGAIAGPSRIQTDFEKVFKPFTLQKDRVMAPSNWFLAEKKRRQRSSLAASDKEVIVLDSDEEVDVEMRENQPTPEQLASAPAQERLDDILSRLPTAATPARFANARSQRSGFKTCYPVSVRDLVSQLSEAEISGNDDLVRSIMSKLNDREILPAKAFCFHTDARPGYFGTWTRSSRIIGPRTPFAKDTLVFDYAYDSGEEWEEEPVGEDVVEDGDEEDGDGDEPDSDLDSWLVDDEEEPDMAMLARGSSPPPLFDLPTLAPPKRKAEDGERKMGKKRKVVVPLVPFAKGPVYESTVGQCHYEPFKPYAIQLFNDTPLSIDPFTFVSSCLEDFKARHTNPTSLNPSSALNANQPEFAVPALPPRLISTVNGGPLPGTSDLSSNSPIASQVPKKVPTVPKATFPDIYMPLLIEKFSQLQSASISALVESIHLDLREHKVKKTAIEAKVREVGEKCKEKKVWVIKPSLLNQQS